MDDRGRHRRRSGFARAAGCRAGRAARGPRLPARAAAAAHRGTRRQDRSHRVLLVRLPALQCARAVPHRLGEEAAARRRVSPHPRALRRPPPPAAVLHARSHGQGRRARRQDLPRDPRRSRPARYGRQDDRAAVALRCRSQAVRRHLGLVRGAHEDAPGGAGLRGLWRRWRAGDGGQRQVLHLAQHGRLQPGRAARDGLADRAGASGREVKRPPA